jgi:hypothetical protein
MTVLPVTAHSQGYMADYKRFISFSMNVSRTGCYRSVLNLDHVGLIRPPGAANRAGESFPPLLRTLECNAGPIAE